MALRSIRRSANPKWVYVAEMNRVVRYAYKTGDTAAIGVPEVVIPQLSPVGGGHFTRDIAFSPDGKRMYVSVGSQSQRGRRHQRRRPPQRCRPGRRSMASAPPGASRKTAPPCACSMWQRDTKGKTFATGLRNCVGMTVQPATGALWCAVNERDMLGDDLVPDYATRVKEGAFYGWPWYYMGNYEDPRLKGRSSGPGRQGHACPMCRSPRIRQRRTSSSTPRPSGSSAFPKEYAEMGIRGAARFVEPRHSAPATRSCDCR